MALRTGLRNSVHAAAAVLLLMVFITSEKQTVVASGRTLTGVSVKLTLVNGTSTPAASTLTGGVASTKDATTSSVLGSAPSATYGSQIASSNVGAVPVLPGSTITPICDPDVGGFTSGWRSASYGCSDCNFTDVVRRRAVDPASIYAEFLPWGALVLEADKPFSGNSQLDFWVKGAGVARAALYLKDTRQRRYSSEVQFSSLDSKTANQQGVRALGSDDDGWIRFQISLDRLVTIPGTTVTQLADVTGWNRIVLKDISGIGFKLQLSSVRLVAMGLSASEDMTIQQLDTTAFKLLPVLNIETIQTSQAAAQQQKYIMKLRSTSMLGDLKSICQELAGALPGGGSSRFRGACDPITLPTVFDFSRPDTTPLPWAFQSFTVNSQVDLDRMRSLLGSSLEYFERDLEASIGVVSTTANSAPSGSADFTSTHNDSSSPSKPLPRKDCACAEEYVPVCGIDGVEYSSACHAWCAGLNDWTPGTCVSKGGPIVDGLIPGGFRSSQTSEANPRSWGLDRIDQTNLPLDNGYRPGLLDGSGTHVYILDTGVRTSHFAFSGRVGEGTTFFGNSFQDDHGHGTHVAGTALGAVYGVARNAILHPIKALDSSGSGSYSNFIAGLGWVKDHVQRNGIRQAVVSMSLDGPRAASLNDAVADLTNAGIPVVVAAGNNNGGDSCSYSPASAPSVIAVGATNSDDTLASYSNVGSCVFTFAPGSNIVSASFSSDTAEATMSGTSMATPHVAGAVAMLLQAYPGASVSTIRDRIAAAASSITISSSSPSRLLNVQTTRLAPSSSTPASTAAPTSTPTAAPTPTATATPTPTSVPSTTWPSSGIFTWPWSSTPTPTSAPTPTPTSAPTPTPTAAPKPSPTPIPTQTPAPSASVPTFFSRPDWCSTCAWCLMCS
ncbi:hypothetical protein Vretifemale_12298 [Volvox reticuliferus]|uniref:Kazal-like domain-containing protein n=1 Tax=Volvox reticuliferus TaxID=1737510 RepID=A0A8J4CNV1_9CHLO|nr:hypothetical protein Vretifemale_12298 [Volvox reticuliferus]